MNSTLNPRRNFYKYCSRISYKYQLLFTGTGTGKTLSFSLPLVEKLLALNNRKNLNGRPPKVLVMAPTRELAKQVAADFESLSSGCANSLTVLTVYGGTPYWQQEQVL